MTYQRKIDACPEPLPVIGTSLEAIYSTSLNMFMHCSRVITLHPETYGQK